MYLILHDGVLSKPTLADDLRTHEFAPIEWHTSTVSRHLASLNDSSLTLARSVAKFGISLYGDLPRPAETQITRVESNFKIKILVDHLVGIRLFAATVPDAVQEYLASKSLGFVTHTKIGKPYEAVMFLRSSELAEHVARLIVAFRNVTPHSIHQLDVLASQLEPVDPYRSHISSLKGAKRVQNISIYASNSASAEDEPVDQSKTRLLGTFRLLRDFLRDNADAFDPIDVSRTTQHRLGRRISAWHRSVVRRLEVIAADSPTETWVRTLTQDATLIQASLSDLLSRITKANIASPSARCH